MAAKRRRRRRRLRRERLCSVANKNAFCQLISCHWKKLAVWRVPGSLFCDRGSHWFRLVAKWREEWSHPSRRATRLLMEWTAAGSDLQRLLLGRRDHHHSAFFQPKQQQLQWLSDWDYCTLPADSSSLSKNENLVRIVMSIPTDHLLKSMSRFIYLWSFSLFSVRLWDITNCLWKEKFLGIQQHCQSTFFEGCYYSVLQVICLDFGF